MTLKFGTQQREAINAVIAWLKDPDAPQVFRLFGYAGSGKTTLAKYIEDAAREIFNTARPTTYCAYTGKAAMVLQQKGCDGASTIHSAIYTPQVDEETGHVVGYDLSTRSPVNKVEYVTLDECSMVNEEQGRDLESFGKKILVLGDPFQLPPVTGEGYFTDGEPDYMMTKIHRNAKDSPIIYMATEIRKGRGLKYGRYGDSAVLRPHHEDDDFYANHDQLICGANKTRIRMNMHARKIEGREGPLPVKNDKLICIKNDKEYAVLNGGMFRTRKVDINDEKKFTAYLQSLDRKQPDGEWQNVVAPVLTAQFLGDRTIDPKKLKGYVQMDFGNVITGHKSQGSQWDTVGIINENWMFGEMSERWYYTTLTRAAERVTVLGK